MRAERTAKRGFGELSEAVLVTALGLIGDATLMPVSRTSALGRYERAGYAIEDVTDIRALDVSVPDGIARKAGRAWTLVAAVTGVATSATGIVGLIADVPTLLANNLMAVGEIASIYGFDVADRDERAYAMALLFMQREARGGRPRAVAYVAEIAHRLRAGRSWEDVRNEPAGRWLREAARELAWYLVKRKAAQVIPGMGTLVAGGVNAQFTARTCRAAREMYRERFVAQAF